MLETKRVATLAIMAVAGGMLSFLTVPAGAQALRLGLSDQSTLAAAATTDNVQWRGGRAGFRAGGARFAGPRMGGARFVGARMAGPRFVGAGMGPRRFAMAHPGWRPGMMHPGWRPGAGWGHPGWGHPGWRPPPGAWGPGPWRPGWGWWRPGWGWGYYDNTGAWIALGVASGLALGAVANDYYGYDNGYVVGDSVAWCMARFRSYDPASGTYLGYDGFRHPCP